VKRIIQILGPTGVGKSQVAVELAKGFGGEIISADSMQVYRDFNIGTAKITEEEMQGIPHYLIGIYSNCSQFNTSIFLRESFEICEDIIRRDRVPITCGGTALYLKSMIKGIFPENKEVRVSREALKRIAGEKGTLYLWERLSRVDSRYAQKIGRNDRVRIIRALEIYYNNGIPPSEIFERTCTPFHDYEFIRIGLNMDREELYRRIEDRVDRMIEQGLQDEVTKLREKYPPDCPPFKSVGYKEMGMFLDGAICFERAVELIKQHSRNFAKRQLSWFRQETDIHWFHPRELHEIGVFVREKFCIP
jgi:tRNA dimethylallyltransferase